MPELPEIEVIKLGLQKRIIGLKLTKIQVLSTKSFIGKPNLIEGRKVLKVWRRAKLLGIDLSASLRDHEVAKQSTNKIAEVAARRPRNDKSVSLLCHLKMTGQLIYEDGKRFIGGHPTPDMIGEMPNSHTRVIFSFSDGSHLYFNDQRKFGWIKVTQSVILSEAKDLKNLGPEPLDQSFTWEIFKQNLLKHRNMPVKVAIMDQNVISGVGNIYANEACFLARIDPCAKVVTLTDKQFQAMYEGVVGALREGIKHGGSTRAHFLDYAYVYGRDKHPCKICKSDIKKIQLGGRGTYFCPNCQKDKATFASVLKNRGFLNLWINQILVQLSYNALNFALIIWVFQLTGSNTAVSALLFSIYLPAVILGLFSGVLVDLIDRKKSIMIIDLLLAVSFFSLIFLKGSFPAVLLVAFFVNALGQFYAPAEASAIPLIAKKHQLISANSMFSATLYSSFLLGFGLAGPLINHLGINFVFGLGGVLLTVAFLLALAFPSIIVKPDEQGKKLIFALRNRKYSDIGEIGLFEILETVKLIRGKLSVLTSIMILAGVQMVIGVLAVLLPGFLETALRIKATDASYVLVIPLGAGIVIGGLVLGKIGQKIVKRVLVSRAIVFGGLLLLLVGIAPIISPAIQHLPRPKPLPFITQPSLSSILAIGSFLLGIAMVSILVPSQTVLQQNTPAADRGKVFSILGVAMSGLSIVPVLLAGLLADVFGITPIFIGLGSMIILLGLFGLSPSLFFRKENLSLRVREFLGLGHWEGK